jgi:serine/threonine-protein kinase
VSAESYNLSSVCKLLGRGGALGQMAILEGLITEDQLDRCLREQRESHRELGQILVSRGFLTGPQLQALLQLQRQLDAPAPQDAGELDPRAIQRMIGRYAIVEELGKGGAGVVYRAWDTQLRRWVALKEPRLTKPLARERFLREAQAAAKLRHPNLVEIFEVVREGDSDLLVMSLVEGKPLEKLPLDPVQAVRVMVQVCDAVDAMHQAGVLHRDIKPENILVDTDLKAYLSDFSLAKILDREGMTTEGTIMGTPQFMAPEQASGQAAGPATDVYGLGASLYLSVTGHPPFEDDSDFATLCKKLVSEVPPSPRALNPSLAPELDAIIRRAMAKDPRDRYAGAAELGADLRRYLNGQAPLARPTRFVTRGFRWIRRNRSVSALVLLAMTGMGIGLAFAFLHTAASSEAAEFQRRYDEGMKHWEHVAHFKILDRPKLIEEARKAIESFERAGTRPEAWWMRGRCELLLGHAAEAEASWTRALQMRPDYDAALFERGKYNLGAYARLRLPENLWTSPRVPPEDARARSLREKGEADLHRARNSELEPAAVRYLEGVLALGKARYADAAAKIGGYLKENSWDTSAWMLHGTACWLARDLPQAAESLSRAIELDPQPYRFKLRGDLRFALKDYAEAVEDYELALRSGGDTAELLCNRGLALQRTGKSERAVDDLKRAVGLNPESARLHTMLGNYFLEAGRLPEAMEEYWAATDKSPGYAEAHHNLGVAYYKQNEIDKAIEAFTDALNSDPDFAEAYYHRGQMFLLKGDAVSALSDLQSAVDHDAKNSDYLFQLATGLAAHGKFAEAVARMWEAIQAAGSDWPDRKQAEERILEWTRH